MYAPILSKPCAAVSSSTLGLAIIVAVHPLPDARGKEPIKHSEAANSERN
jgi:hypothetical protein